MQIYSFWVWVLQCTLFRPKRNVTSILWGSGWRCRILGIPRRSLTSWPLSAVLPRLRPRLSPSDISRWFSKNLAISELHLQTLKRPIEGTNLITELKATSLTIFALSLDGILFWRPPQLSIVIIAGTRLVILDRLREKIISGAVPGRINSRGLTGEEG